MVERLGEGGEGLYWVTFQMDPMSGFYLSRKPASGMIRIIVFGNPDRWSFGFWLRYLLYDVRQFPVLVCIFLSLCVNQWGFECDLLPDSSRVCIK